jgi:hypothetical protein
MSRIWRRLCGVAVLATPALVFAGAGAPDNSITIPYVYGASNDCNGEIVEVQGAGATNAGLLAARGCPRPSGTSTIVTKDRLPARSWRSQLPRRLPAGVPPSRGFSVLMAP